MNPIKLSTLDTTYTTDNKTYVKCILKCRLTSPEKDKKDSNILVFIGVAKLHEEDKFDSVLGCKIALAKAERKAYKTCSKVIEEELNHINEVCKHLEDFCYKANCMIVHNTNYIKDLVK